MISMVDYNPVHIDRLKRRSCYNGFSSMKDNINNVLVSKTGQAKSLIDGDVVVAVVGYTILHSGVAEFWSVTGDDLQKRPIAFHKVVSYLVDHAFKELKLHRAQVLVKASYACGKRWAESLGFVQESFMKRFGPGGEDYIQFVKLGDIV